ncbi:MAG: hypothetical protein ACREBT_00610 [Thermoplasmata archaeon]
MAREISRWPYVALVVIILVVAAVAAAAVSVWVFPHVSPHSIATVEEGDNVTVNYIGVLGSGADQGHVFDTSYYSVAINNATWPKSLTYTPRGNASQYTQLGVHVGPTTPKGGYVVNNYTFGSVITGFWQGIIGMAGNTTQRVSIPPSLGYGPVNRACLVVQPLVYTIPVSSTFTVGSFSSAYPGVTPSSGVSFTDPTYGWTDYIVAGNGSWVTLLNVPTLGQTTHSDGLPYFVSNINSARITLTSTLVDSQAGAIVGKIPGGSTVCGTSTFIVSSINWAAGTLTWSFNPEVVGQTLVFYITLVNIFPPR